MINKSEADIRNVRLAFRNNSKGSDVMSPVGFVLFPLACSLAYVLGYSLRFGKLMLWPIWFTLPSIATGMFTGNERLSVYVYVGTMFAIGGLAILGTAAINQATKQLEESK